MSSYLSLLRAPEVSGDRVSEWRAQHATRTYFAAIEEQILKLSEDLTATGRDVALTFGDDAILLRLRDRGPSLTFSIEVRKKRITRAWMDVGSTLAPSDVRARVPVPSDAANYEADAEALMRELVPTVNALLE